MNSTPLIRDFDTVVNLVNAIFKQARNDAKRGDRSAVQFLRLFNVPVPTKRRKQESKTR